MLLNDGRSGRVVYLSLMSSTHDAIRTLMRRSTTDDNVQRFTLAGAARGPLGGDPNSWDPRR
jgi:hypothetical protein